MRHCGAAADALEQRHRPHDMAGLFVPGPRQLSNCSDKQNEVLCKYLHEVRLYT